MRQGTRLQNVHEHLRIIMSTQSLEKDHSPPAAVEDRV